MSVADLTGTTWLINSSPTPADPTLTASVNFTSNNDPYTGLTLYDEMDADGSIAYRNPDTLEFPVIVYDGYAWSSEAYRTISISGGADATNSTLISWFEANATQVVQSHDVTISYNNATIATMDASGTEVLETNGTICADDITIEYVKPAAPTPSLQAKTNIAPTTSSQTITPDSGYDGLSSVQINAMQTMTLPSSTSNSSSGTSRATIAASTSTKYLNIPKGYNTTARYYTLSAISPTKSAQTYTPTTSNQTIASGQWLSGAQTISGDANLVAGNIKKDVSIFGVTGTYEGGGGGGGQLYVFVDKSGYEQTEGYVGGSQLTTRVAYSGASLTVGATVTLYTYGDWILDSVTGETSGTTISFNTVSRGNYTFTMPNESVYCALLFDD